MVVLSLTSNFMRIMFNRWCKLFASENYLLLNSLNEYILSTKHFDKCLVLECSYCIR